VPWSAFSIEAVGSYSQNEPNQTDGFCKLTSVWGLLQDLCLMPLCCEAERHAVVGNM